jgi:hypothetical protein
LPAFFSWPTFALASAQSGESGPASKGAPVTIALLPDMTRSISNLGARIPPASDRRLRAIAVSSTAGIALSRAL